MVICIHLDAAFVSIIDWVFLENIQNLSLGASSKYFFPFAWSLIWNSNIIPMVASVKPYALNFANNDIIMGFYDKAFDNGLQAKAAGSKPILFPANQNLGRSGLYHS